MASKRFTEVAAAIVVVSLAAAYAAQAQTAVAPDVVSEVTVVGKRSENSDKPNPFTTPPKAGERALRLRRDTASSCTFSARANSTYIEDYLTAFTGSATRQAIPLVKGSITAEGDVVGENQDDGFFSSNSPHGDASTDPRPQSEFFSKMDAAVREPPSETAFEPVMDTCMEQDRRFVAGRADIARRDKTIPDGYALYDDGKYPEAAAMFRRAYGKLQDADGGTEAALMVGKISLQQLKDGPEAIVWLKKAAGASFNAGDRKIMPAFDPKDPAASMTDLSEAAMLLAQINLTGEGGPRDLKAAVQWLERANTVGYVPAGKMLGDIYYKGVGVPKDLKAAARYYRAAATLGYAPAQYALGAMYDVGEIGEPDLKSALAWYAQAAKLDHPRAQYALAVAYDSGEGVAANPQTALAYYKAAAVAGDIDAQSALATYFYQGELVERDLATARRWFEAAAVRGNPDAMFNLAAMLMKGEGGEADRVKAWVWFKLAERGRHPNAAAAVRAIEGRMNDAEKQTAANFLSPARAG